MYIEELIISNYKSCQFIDLKLSETIPNIFIGLNDSGKSTILNSLNLLLGDKLKYNYVDEGNNKKDLSNSIFSLASLNSFLESKNLPSIVIEENSTTIIGKLIYEDAENEVFSDLNLTNPLMWSIECNESKVFWLVKNFYKNSIRTFILVKEGSEKALELWNAAQAELNKQIKEYKVTAEEINNENGTGRFTNLEKLRAIYLKQDCINIWTEYKPGKNDKDIFPSFNLFDWNTSLDEIISTANAIMQEEIQEYLNPIKIQASEGARLAEVAINERFGELSGIIKEVAKDVEAISSKVHFDVKEKISDVMVTKTHSDGPIHLESQGEGLKRQIWFSLIKAKANSAEDSNNKFIWAFDEPETHLYPGAQREFFDILNNISKGDVQTLISTHSTIFTDKSNLNKINSIKQNKGYTEVNYCADIESIFSSLNIKNSDFLFYDKFLVVEGDTEQHLIPKLYEIYTESTLINDNIQLINIQGKNKWTQNKAIIDKIMSGFQKTEDKIVYLFDNDMSFEIGAAAITDNMFFVGEQDIEDSLDNVIWVDILNNFYKGILSFSNEELDFLKSQIPQKKICQDFEKFYPLLKKLVKKKCIEKELDYDKLNRIPSKGSESAEFILKFIHSSEDIPIMIKNAFDRLNKENDNNKNKPKAKKA